MTIRSISVVPLAYEDRLQFLDANVCVPVMAHMSNHSSLQIAIHPQSMMFLLNFNKSNITFDTGFFKKVIIRDDFETLKNAFYASAKNLTELRWQGRFKTADGSEKWFALRCMPHFHDNETIVWRGAFLDKTEEHGLRQELHTHKQVATRSARLAALGELAVAIGHEINNPLAALIGRLEVMNKKLSKGSVTQEGIREYLDKQRESCHRLGSIVSGLRKFSHMSSSTEMEGSVKSAIDSSIQLVKEIYTKESIDIKIDVVSDDPIVTCDTTLLQQVFVNMLVNARDALAGRENKQIKICINDEPNSINISFEDNGCGIDKEDIDKIFNSFFTTKDAEDGTGIGLFISKSIIETSGGTINVSSQKGTGTTFHLSIPKLHQAKTITNISQAKQGFEQPLSILIVDDEVGIRDFLRKMLEIKGFKVHEAQNGQEAMEIVIDQKFDVILTDLRMPKMSGSEFLAELKKNDMAKDTKKIVMTGLETEFDCGNKVRYGKIEGILEKPLDQTKLTSLILGDEITH